MPQRYTDAILKFLADRDYHPLKTRQLAKAMGVADEEYGTFRQAVKELHETGRAVLGSKDTLMLPEIPAKVVGYFRGNPRGFGFVVPETPNAHGDLFIPPDATGGAITGDKVVARTVSQGRREGKPMFAGQIVEIVQRGRNRFVGELQRANGAWFVLPDGTAMTTAIVVRDIGAAGPKRGSKVVVEIVDYGRLATDFPTGVIVEDLGPKGQLEVETRAMIRQHGLAEQFSPQALEDARTAITAFDPDNTAGRLDLTGKTIITIDPADARDFDDAISLEDESDGQVTLGVHIADVSHFVREGTKLDEEAQLRGTSVYFPRKVVPMLPEILSNGVCSLQEGQRRFCKSVFITYDRGGKVVSRRFAETVIASAKRLTYEQAQHICDGKVGVIPQLQGAIVVQASPPADTRTAQHVQARRPHHKTATTLPCLPPAAEALQVGCYDAGVIDLLHRMEVLARKIEARRQAAGMLHLDLPEVQLVFDDDNRVINAVPEDTSYTHTIIEMFMVEANEAVADLLDSLDVPFLRRIHPDPDKIGGKQLAAFVHACGRKLSAGPSPQELQGLLASVRGRPESYAINLALLKTFEQAEYSPLRVGHFALGSKHYCHFTSPIRRYPDLTVHRLLARYCRGKLDAQDQDRSKLVRLAEHCNTTERQAAAAEEELRQVLVLQFLASQVGECFEGVITGITNFGLFVQSPRFLIDGLLRLGELGDDWWDVSARDGEVRGQASGRKFRIGDLVAVQIAGVDIARRQLNLVLDTRGKGTSRWGKVKPPKTGKKAKASNRRNHSSKGKAKGGRRGRRGR